MKTLVSRIQCNKCKDIITSNHRHDFVQCKCGACALDGGNDYFRFVGDGTFTDMSLHEDSPYEEIRQALSRGGRGKDGKQPLKYVPLKDMSDAWLEAVIEYELELRPNNRFILWCEKELEYRKQNNITIED